MKTKYLILCIVGALSLSSCFNYEAQFEGAYEDPEVADPGVLPKSVVLVAGGNVYLADDFFEEIDMIEGVSNVEIASINHAHTKVLFQEDGQNIQIYDLESKSIIGEVPESEKAMWFDYHRNNETVYFLTVNGWMHTHGPDILAQEPFNFRMIDFSSRVTGAAVLEDGRIVFSTFLPGGINNRSLKLTDQALTRVEEYKLLQASATNFRINEAENILWAGTEFNNWMNFYRIPSLNFYDDDTNMLFGAPLNFETGYKVNQNNMISGPGFFSKDSPGGEITSIDF